MQLEVPYKNLNHALRMFRTQVSESIPYAIETLPKQDSPEKVFEYLKARTTYVKDPKNVELFQLLQTLLTKNNFHGIVGAGDCDCFTIAALSCLIANGFTDSGIVLVGRNPLVPVHIYAYTVENGQHKYLDLTNKKFNQERFYPYKQHIPYKLNQEEKNMMLQLAEGPSKSLYRPHPYIYFPQKRVQVREDYFDSMPPGKFQHMLLEEGIEPQEIAELSAKRAERKAAKAANPKQPRSEKRSEKKEAKPRQQKKAAKTDIKKSRAEKNRMKGQAKLNKSQQPRKNIFGGDQDKSLVDRLKDVTDSTGSIIDTYSNARNAIFNPGSPSDAEPARYNTAPQPGDSSADTEKGSDGVATGFINKLFVGNIEVFGMAIPKSVAWIGGTALAYGGYKLYTRKK